MNMLSNVKESIQRFSNTDIKDFNYVVERLEADNIQYQPIQDIISNDKNYTAIQIYLPNRVILLSPNTVRDNSRVGINVNIIPLTLADPTIALSANSLVYSVLDLTESSVSDIIGYIKGVKEISITFKDK